MTYCLALRLEGSLVFLSDTRTNAGLDNINTYRKMHVIDAGPDRTFILQSAGNLATTQEVLDRIQRDLSGPGDIVNLATVGHLFEAALYIGNVSRAVVNDHRASLNAVGADATASFILGGQVGNEPPDILFIYPEGNYIRASDEQPFLQIGETKYGKFWLELAVHAQVDLDDAVKVALSSMLSTARANLSVGPPYDLGIYHNGSFRFTEHRIDANSPYLTDLSRVWVEQLEGAISNLPRVPFDT